MQKRDKPRLLVLTSTYPRWSGDHEPGFVHALARRLTEHFEVYVIAPHAPGACRAEILDDVSVERFRYAPERLQTLVNNGGIIGNLRSHRWKWLLLLPFFFAQILSTFRALRRLKPGVVHAHWLLPQGLTIALLAGRSGTPFVLTSHGADLFALRGTAWRFMKSWVCKRASAITVVSQAMRRATGDLNALQSKVFVKPMGVDLDARFTPDPRVERDPNQLLFVGRLVEKKGVRFLLEALPLVIDQHPHVTLTIAGFGPEEKALRELALRLNIDERLTFLGAVPQEALPLLYRRAQLFIAPFTTSQTGDQEGLGLVLVEALGCGCPVLAGDVAAVRDVLPNDWQRVQPTNRVELASAISDLLSHSAVDLAEMYQPTFHENHKNFAWPCVATGYAKLLKDTIEPKAGNIRPYGRQ